MGVLKEFKNQLIIIFVVYIIFCICVVGGFLATSTYMKTIDIPKGANQVNLFTEAWKGYLIKPITVLGIMFSTESMKTTFLGTCGVVLFAFVYLTVVLIQKSRKNHDYAGEEHGSSDWAKGGEEFKKMPDGGEILNKNEGFILSTKHYLGTDGRKVKINKNILVFGGSGTGKTTCFIKPNILQKLGSYVITDPKGELYRDTSKFLREAGYDVKVLNLVDTKYSNRYNPLAHIYDDTDVDIIAHTIVQGGGQDSGQKSNDPFWDETAKMLLKACIYYVISVLPEEEQNLSSCLNIVRAGGADETIFDKLFIAGLKPSHPGRKQYEGIKVGADKTKQSIAISLVSKLTHFDSQSMQRLTTSNDIDFEEIGRKKTAVYVISPDSHTTYNYILTIFYAQLLQRLYAEADRNGGALKQPTYLLLDEFPNIGKIPDFNQKLSTSRSRMISMSIIVQSLDQLIDLYKDLHENIIANCDTQLFLGSQSLKTCEYFSKSLGQKTLTYMSKSKNRDNKDWSTQGYSYSEQRQGRELMTIDELKRLPMDDEILLVRGIKPILAKKAWWFRYHPLRNEIEKYKIHDNSEMPIVSDAPVKIVDVEEHLNERSRKAKETLSASLAQEGQKDIDIDISDDEKSNNENKKIVVDSETNELDLQKELEKKFDELFGSNNSDVEE